MAANEEFDLGFSDESEKLIDDAIANGANEILDAVTRIDRVVENSVVKSQALIDSLGTTLQSTSGTLLNDASGAINPLIELGGPENFSPGAGGCESAAGSLVANVGSFQPTSGQFGDARVAANWSGDITAILFEQNQSFNAGYDVRKWRFTVSSPGVDVFILDGVMCGRPVYCVGRCVDNFGRDFTVDNTSIVLIEDNFPCPLSPEPPEEPNVPPEEPPEEPTCETGNCNTCGCSPCCCADRPEPPTCPDPDERWQVWKSASGDRDCYVISNREDPREISDTLVREFKQRQTAEAYAEENCPDEEPTEPTEPTDPGIPGDVPNFNFGCGLDAYAAGLSQPDYLKPLLDAVLKILETKIGDPSKLDDIAKLFGVVPYGNAFIWEKIQEFFDWIAAQLRSFSSLMDLTCEPGANIEQAKFVVLIIDVLEKWLGTDLNPVAANLRYVVNGKCPFLQPTLDQAAAGWLNGMVDDGELETLLKINAACPESFKPLIYGNRSKLASGFLAEALRREIIDPATFERELRSSGFIEDKDADILYRMTEFIPPPTDLVRFMVRDVEDPAIVGKFGLDDEFRAKFQGASEEWARKQGVDDETMRRYWRAHWSIPSATQLYEMYHRLRNDKNPNLQVDRETVKTALQQQDILPFWVDRLLEVSFNPLTRVDTRRAYELGDIDEDGVAESYAAQGYSDQNINILTRFSTTLKNEGVDSQTPVKRYRDGLERRETAEVELRARGFAEDVLEDSLWRADQSRLRRAHSLRPYTQFIDGILTEEEFREELFKWNFPPEIAQEIVEQAEREIERSSRKACIAALRTRFFWGELTEQELKEELLKLGVPDKFASATARRINCEQVSAEKQGTLREFFRWLETGVAQPSEIVERLRRLRYDDKTARTIVASMVERLNLREEKERKAEEEREAKRLKAEERAKLRSQKQAQALLERAARLQDAARDAAERRALQIEKAAAKFADKFNVALEETQDRLQTLALFVRRTTDLNADRQMQAVVQAVDFAVKSDNQDLESIISAVSDSIESWLEAAE